jgi:intracellular septation protein A
MNLTMLFLTIIPIIAFVWLDAKAGPKQAIYGAVILSLVLLAINILVFKQLDWLTFAEPVLFIVLGYISLKFNNTKFFKFQPALLSFIFGAVLFAYHYSSHPLFVRYLPMMEKMVEPAVWQTINSPTWIEKLKNLGVVLGYVFIAHGILMSYVAFKSRTFVWLVARLAIYPIMFVTVVIVIIGL